MAGSDFNKKKSEPALFCKKQWVCSGFSECGILFAGSWYKKEKIFMLYPIEACGGTVNGNQRAPVILFGITGALFWDTVMFFKSGTLPGYNIIE